MKGCRHLKPVSYSHIKLPFKTREGFCFLLSHFSPSPSQRCSRSLLYANFLYGFLAYCHTFSCDAQLAASLFLLFLAHKHQESKLLRSRSTPRLEVVRNIPRPPPAGTSGQGWSQWKLVETDKWKHDLNLVEYAQFKRRCIVFPGCFTIQDTWNKPVNDSISKLREMLFSYSVQRRCSCEKGWHKVSISWFGSCPLWKVPELRHYERQADGQLKGGDTMAYLWSSVSAFQKAKLLPCNVWKKLKVQRALSHSPVLWLKLQGLILWLIMLWDVKTLLCKEKQSTCTLYKETKN